MLMKDLIQLIEAKDSAGFDVTDDKDDEYRHLYQEIFTKYKMIKIGGFSNFLSTRKGKVKIGVHLNRDGSWQQFSYHIAKPTHKHILGQSGNTPRELDRCLDRVIGYTGV
jgi:hypothetical protein